MPAEKKNRVILTSEGKKGKKKHRTVFLGYSLSNSTQEVKKKCAARIYFSGYNPGNRENFCVPRSARSAFGVGIRQPGRTNTIVFPACG